MAVNVKQPPQIPMGRMIYQFLGMILCGLVSVPTVTAGSLDRSQNAAIKKEVLSYIQSTEDFGSWHNPFTPIKKERSLPSRAKKGPPQPIQREGKKSGWRLLSIMHGRSGQLAVIQVSSGERLIVSPGMKLSQFGWIVKSMNMREVFLEPLTSPLSEEGRFISQPLILSFPIQGKLD